MINTTIAHYKITSKLGQGGMGEVYRATDTKLDRDVAIKILPDEFAGDKNRVARFKREAKILRLRYGLDGSDPMTLKDIGKKNNLTRERVRQIERDELRKIKEHLEE